MGLPAEIVSSLVPERSKKRIGVNAARGVDEQVHVGELPQREVTINVTGKDGAFERQERETGIAAESHDTNEFGCQLPVARDPRVQLLLKGDARRRRNGRAGALGGGQGAMQQGQDLMPCRAADQVRPIASAPEQLLEDDDVRLSETVPDTLE